MDVIIRLYAELRKIFGRKEIRLPLDRDHVTVGQVIDNLLATSSNRDEMARLIFTSPIRAPYNVEHNTINPTLILMVNDVDARLTEGTSTILSDGDVLTLLPTVHGG
ncbi:MAG: MoaD/ThiS family protein [Candidatus Sigynarchaeota archaeon]